MTDTTANIDCTLALRYLCLARRTYSTCMPSIGVRQMVLWALTLWTVCEFCGCVCVSASGWFAWVWVRVGLGGWEWVGSLVWGWMDATEQVGINKRIMVFNPEGDKRKWLAVSQAQDIYISVHTCKYIYPCIYIYKLGARYICIYVCVYIYIFSCVYAFLTVCRFMYICTYVYTFIHVYTYR